MRFAMLIAAGLPLLAQDPARFRALLTEHADSATLRKAAAQWEANEHDPVRHLLAVQEIARTFLDSDPALSLEYCRKVPSAPQLWPILFDAEVRLGDWPMAARYGEAVMEEIDAGRLYPHLSEEPEALRIRKSYAAALAHLGKPAPGVAIPAEEHARRIANLKSDVLASELHLTAEPLRLHDRNGRQVSLDDYRGRPLIAIFWATWCAPCVAELREINRYFEKHPEGFITISTDENPETARQFARQYGYHFPILSGDRETERKYTAGLTLLGANVPQLYVFDSRGEIRFHVIGFDDDGMLVQKLEWMTQSAPK